MSVDEPLELESTAVLKGSSELLAEARKRLGLSQKEVADELYLRTSFIEYIDVGEFTSIPKPAFIKGYLRAYARVVELSGDEIVAVYEAEQQVAEPTLEIKRVTEEDVGTASITGPVFQTGLMGLVGLALAFAVIWWMVSSPEKEAPLSVTYPRDSQPAAKDSLEDGFDFVPPLQKDEMLQSEQVSQEQKVSRQAGSALQPERLGALRPSDEVEPEPAETVGENSEDSAILMGEESILEAVTGQPFSEQDKLRFVENGVKLDPTADETQRFVTVDASGADQLELLFSDECWVEIADNQHGLIYNDLNRANDVLTIYGTGPFEVLLGKATGVEMIYNGVAFDLESFVGSDRTAKLTVPK